MRRKRLFQTIAVLVLVTTWLLVGLAPFFNYPGGPLRVSVVNAITAGPLFTGTGANFNDGGTTAWSTPTNIQGNDTSTAATVNIGTNGGTSQRLRASNFGFSIPSNATIDGVTVEIERQAANTNRHYWDSVRLLVGGTETGNDNSDGSAISNSKVFTSFGSSSDGWGAGLTYSDVNSSGFGVSIKLLRNSTPTTTTSIFRVRITVDYSVIVAPSLSMSGVTNITTTTATFNGNITDTGGENADIRGFVYDTSTRSLPGNVAPTSSGYAYYTQSTGSFGTGAYTANILGLVSGETYYVRSFAHNSAGYSYGSPETSFTTGFVAVSITSDGLIEFGSVGHGDYIDTTMTSDTQTASNDGNVVADFMIKASNSGDWSLGISSAQDIFTLTYKEVGEEFFSNFTAADSYATLATDIFPFTSRSFDIGFSAPNPSTVTTGQSITITILVTESCGEAC